MYFSIFLQLIVSPPSEQGLLTSGYIILLSRVGERVAADMRKTLFASLLRYDASVLLQRDRSDAGTSGLQTGCDFFMTVDPMVATATDGICVKQ